MTPEEVVAAAPCLGIDAVTDPAWVDCGFAKFKHPECAVAALRQAEMLGEYEDSGWRGHPTPDGLRLMSLHDKNSVHMDGCITLYRKKEDR